MKYRRAWTMAQYQGRLFCSTLPSGRVHSLEAGPCVTHDRELAPGWQHVAAVKHGGVLRLYVDGKPVAESAEFDPAKFDLTTDEPLLHRGRGRRLLQRRARGRPPVPPGAERGGDRPAAQAVTGRHWTPHRLRAGQQTEVAVRSIIPLSAVMVLLSTAVALAGLKAGAAVVDVTPDKFPVLVNGGMLSQQRRPGRPRGCTPGRSSSTTAASSVAIVVVDSCMMPRRCWTRPRSWRPRRTKIRPTAC